MTTITNASELPNVLTDNLCPYYSIFMQLQCEANNYYITHFT